MALAFQWYKKPVLQLTLAQSVWPMDGRAGAQTATAAESGTTMAGAKPKWGFCSCLVCERERERGKAKNSGKGQKCPLSLNGSGGSCGKKGRNEEGEVSLSLCSRTGYTAPGPGRRAVNVAADDVALNSVGLRSSLVIKRWGFPKTDSDILLHAWIFKVQRPAKT